MCTTLYPVPCYPRQDDGRGFRATEVTRIRYPRYPRDGKTAAQEHGGNARFVTPMFPPVVDWIP